ncbi:hypothetical protein AXE85_06460 [Gemella sp. oral taxon 928]|nr:hypothetical protein AXE85_06460 [Gemella sp. oral taxon 928]
MLLQSLNNLSNIIRNKVLIFQGFIFCLTLFFLIDSTKNRIDEKLKFDFFITNLLKDIEKNVNIRYNLID